MDTLLPSAVVFFRYGLKNRLVVEWLQSIEEMTIVSNIL